MDSAPTEDLTSLFVYSKLAEVIDFPLTVVNNFEEACKLWTKRLQLYDLPDSLPRVEPVTPVHGLRVFVHV